MSVFTPRISASSQDRMHMRLDFRDDAKVTRGRKWRVTRPRYGSEVSCSQRQLRTTWLLL